MGMTLARKKLDREIIIKGDNNNLDIAPSVGLYRVWLDGLPELSQAASVLLNFNQPAGMSGQVVNVGILMRYGYLEPGREG